MNLTGRVKNGVVVLDGGVVLPEGTVVTVHTQPETAADRKRRVQFPLVPSSAPGSVELTNARIAEILDEDLRL